MLCTGGCWKSGISLPILYKQATNEHEKTNENIITILAYGFFLLNFDFTYLNREFLKIIFQLIKDELWFRLFQIFYEKSNKLIFEKRWEYHYGDLIKEVIFYCVKKKFVRAKLSSEGKQ